MNAKGGPESSQAKHPPTKLNGSCSWVSWTMSQLFLPSLSPYWVMSVNLGHLQTVNVEGSLCLIARHRNNKRSNHYKRKSLKTLEASLRELHDDLNWKVLERLFQEVLDPPQQMQERQNYAKFIPKENLCRIVVCGLCWVCHKNLSEESEHISSVLACSGAERQRALLSGSSLPPVAISGLS